jgi:ferric-dicitrate binding protein FerR (iron transport regulator)
MASRNQHSNLSLARLIDQQNRGELVVFSQEDAFVQQLMAFRNEALSGATVSDTASRIMWNEISRATRPNPSVQVISLQSLIKYAAAAVLLLAAVWAVFLITQNPDFHRFATTENMKVVTLDDGSKVTLRPFTTLTETSVSGNGVTYHLDGEAFFEVITNPDRMFSITSAAGKIDVLGTTFNVSTWGGKTRVYLVNGTVQITRGDDPARVLNPREQAVLDEAGLVIETGIEQDETIHWMAQTLRFRERDVQSILAELSHHFNITLRAPETVASQTLSGTIILAERDQTLLDLGLVLGGSFRQSSASGWDFVPAQ